jgi:hypothetical protein
MDSLYEPSVQLNAEPKDVVDIESNLKEVIDEPEVSITLSIII